MEQNIVNFRARDLEKKWIELQRNELGFGNKQERFLRAITIMLI